MQEKIETLVTEENLLFCTMYNMLMFYKAYLLVIITLLENRSGNINNYLSFLFCFTTRTELSDCVKVCFWNF